MNLFGLVKCIWNRNSYNFYLIHRKKANILSAWIRETFPTESVANESPDYFFLHGKCCLNTDFTFLEKSKFKVKSLHAYVGTHVRGPLAQKKLFHVSNYCIRPGVGHLNDQNCWILALNRAVAHGLLHNAGKVHGCFILVKKNSST